MVIASVVRNSLSVCNSSCQNQLQAIDFRLQIPDPSFGNDQFILPTKCSPTTSPTHCMGKTSRSHSPSLQLSYSPRHLSQIFFIPFHQGDLVILHHILIRLLDRLPRFFVQLILIAFAAEGIPAATFNDDQIREGDTIK